MPIDGINTAMTTLQFASARSRTRTIETTDHTNPRANPARTAPTSPPAATFSGHTTSRPPRLIAPPSFHCTYRPLPGKSAAKRLPQLADSAYWSFAINRLG